jgi:hypothetical protein
VSTGTAPFSIASTTPVTNLNAQLHGGLLAPSSSIVGVSDTQTLTNKTLTAPVINGNNLPSSGITLLNAQGDGAQITGNNTALTVFTYTIPANTVATLKGIRVTVGYSHSVGTGSVSYALNLNGQTVAASSNSTTGSISDIHTILATGSTTGDRVTIAGNSPAQGIASTLAGLAWTSSQTLVFTFNAASTEKVTPIAWIVELIQ